MRLDDRALPSVTLPDGTVWVAPMLSPDQTAPNPPTDPTPYGQTNWDHDPSDGPPADGADSGDGDKKADDKKADDKKADDKKKEEPKVGDPVPDKCPLGRHPKNKTEKEQANFGKSGHTWERHGADTTDDFQKKRAVDLGHQVGRWKDYEETWDHIKKEYPKMKIGENTIDIPKGMGEIILPDGTITSEGVIKARVIIDTDGSVTTAFPINPDKPTKK
jgi:hypothetical protein